MSPRTITRRTRVVTAALLTLALAATGACSVDDGGSGGDKPTIRLAYQAFPSGDLVVKNKRWLEDALPGYSIRWTKFDSGADINTAFVAGQVDFGAIGSSPVARGLSAPLNIKYKVAFVLDVAGDNEALVARTGTNIRSVADLRGKRVATPFASTSHYSLLAALAQGGVPASDVNLIDLQPQAALAAWQRGDVDAVYVWLPTLDTLRKSGTQIVSSKQLAANGKPTLDLGVVSDDFATKHPDAVDAWRKVETRALRLIADDRSAAATAVAKELSISDADATAQLQQGIFLTPQQLASPTWLGTDGSPGALATNLQSAAQFLADQKQIPAAPPLSTFQSALYTTGLPGALGNG